MEGYCWGAVRGFRIPNIVSFDNKFNTRVQMELNGNWNLSSFSLGNGI